MKIKMSLALSEIVIVVLLVVAQVLQEKNEVHVVIELGSICLAVVYIALFPTTRHDPEQRREPGVFDHLIILGRRGILVVGWRASEESTLIRRRRSEVLRQTNFEMTSSSYVVTCRKTCENVRSRLHPMVRSMRTTTDPYERQQQDRNRSTVHACSSDKARYVGESW